ncbi:MAG: hypothetical protein LLG37_02905 [Spirochaetia bacterium]|nr:hypothetical protein [Spirochaetia bacterium]
MGKITRNLVFAFSLFVISIFFSAGANAAYIISSLNFQLSPVATTAKIGDYVLFRMCVVNATDTFQNVTVNSVTNTSIVVSSPDFNGIFPLYVYDGVRTWVVNAYQNTSLKTVALSDTNLAAGIPPLGTGYATLQYADFNASTGSLAAGGTASINIGTAIYGIPMYDDGLAAHNDTGALPDGVYGARFQVRESYQFNITNTAIEGNFTKAGVKAGNSPYTSANRISIDGIRPKIELVNATPNPFNPNKQLLQLFYYLTESSALTCVLLDSVGNTVITLSTDGIFGYNNPLQWDGLDSAGNLRTDGDYWYRFDIADGAGNTGLAFTGKLKVTTIELVASIYSIDAEYIQTSQDETMVTLNLETLLTNATTANLANLGFDYTAYEVPGVSHDYENYPWQYVDLRIYDSQGSLFSPTVKDHTAFDTDLLYMNIQLDPLFYDGLPMAGFTPNPLPDSGCGIINTGTVYTKGDGDDGNDWDCVFGSPFVDQGAGVFKADTAYIYHQIGMAAGTYIAAFKAVLTGKTIISVSENGPSSETLECSMGGTTTSYTVTSNPYHVIPSFFYDESYNVSGDERGYGLSSNDRTVSFIVEQNPAVPNADSTPPSVVANSEYPSNNSVKEPGIINSSNYVKVTLTDDGVGAGPVNLSTIILKDPYGNQVQGHTAWNAGTPGTKTWEIYYIPDSPITLGGVYKLQIIPIDAAYNIGAAVEYTFEVNDTSIPQAGNMNVQSGSGGSLNLTESTATQVNFLVSKMEVTLIPGGSAAIDWTNCSISVSGAAGTYDHESGTNIMSFTPSTVITDGQYTVYVTAVSSNGYQGVYTYVFYVTTAGMVYVNLDATTVESVNTCMRISSFDTAVSGITDNNGTMVPANLITVAAQTGPQYPPSGYTIVGNTVAFSAGATYQMPFTFNSNFCMATLRMHYTDAHLAALLASGKKETDLTVWYWNGSVWTQITTIGTPVTGGADHYIDVSLSGLPANNKYALMYQTPVEAPATFHFNNTKAFDPSSGPAVIYYADSITNLTEARVYIYNLTGSLVRTLQTEDVADPANVASDPMNPATIKYFFVWDGKNDRGSTVRNGIYAVKISLKYSDGTTSTASRLIAVVK